jgi:hypothetical protein
MRALFWFVLLITASTLVDARGSKATSNGDDAATLASCPPQGDAKKDKERDLNQLKRRMDVPSQIDSRVTLAAILAPGDDTTRWDEHKGGVISGYVAEVKPGEAESVNCHTKDPQYKDTHIVLTPDPLSNDESKYVIVEITPQWRAQMAKDGVDWSTSTLRKTLLGRWIRVTGWLMFDVEHKAQSANTAGRGKVWRATAWEIHPITKIEVLPGKPKG